MSSKSHAALRYTAMRLGVFVLCFFAVWALTAFGILPAGVGESNFLWVILLALVISAPLSYVLLRRQREEMSVQIAERMENTKQRIAANRSQEDEADDAARNTRG
ncbi:DUF4229 domain-containing protein [Streptomyces sp. NPDC059506]|uniref:DUF4229 domain-containing protein n=1 Tax=Streptomyces TaxID=1883 RepID=UPI000CC80940|nr:MULTISPECIES: DUF4229 domain-containing protein [unclassified Streptomyces]MCZ2524030.1 DUF4229 domain-containing protein [Streptomyces sp. HB2AG]PLW64324.1 DUF4229 domain-containing protein [Streptomyces sp. DJ]QMV22783.1 DUF4229 domain-containing protein [Streptomyces sp. SCUT-3]